MKEVQLFFIVLFVAMLSDTYGQLPRKDKAFVDKKEIYYHYLEPNQEVRGVLILLPGWGESSESIFTKTLLPKILAQLGVVTVVPKLPNCLYADKNIIAQITGLIDTQSKRYRSQRLSVFIGGLSAGGSIAVSYAEHILENDSTINLQGVFAIDPPLDLSRLYKSAENKTRYNCQSRLIHKEGDFIKKYLRGSFGGTPDEKPLEYLKYSGFSSKHQDGGNARFLKSIPIRLYTEPDLDFVRNKYCMELQYEDINAIDLEKLTTYLLSIGNNNAKYITTKGRGFHSWNIIDAQECANWIIGLMDKTNH